MSGLINNMVLRKRQKEVDASERQRFLADARGERGEPGPTGTPGAPGAIPLHEWQGTALRFQKPDGKWGKFTDLQGKPGDDGKTRVVVAGGRSSGGGMGDLLPGTSNAEPTGLAVVQGGQWVNLPWGAFISAISGAIDMGSEFSRRTDFVGDTVVYRGEAAPGASESTAVWRIKKIEFVTGADGKQDVKETWAGGNAGFTNVWADRTGLAFV